MGGLAKFDGTNWTVYNTSNSDLPDNNIQSTAIDNTVINGLGLIWAVWLNLMEQTGLFIILPTQVCRIIMYNL